MRSLYQDAERAGVAVSYRGTDGSDTRVSEETLALVMAALQNAGALELQRSVAPKDGKCYLPDFLVGGRAWGISLQLYELRSERNAGIGDFADLAEVCRIAGGLGADFVGCNPLHALFIADPGQCSPFYPSNRRFLNPLYIAVDRVPGVIWTPDQLSLAARLRGTDLVNYEEISALKLALLRTAWLDWVDANELPRADFVAFQEQVGSALSNHALFDALSCHFVARGYRAGWRDWPLAYRQLGSAQVALFASDCSAEIEFHKWLQWIASRQLAEARAVAQASGMRIGLYLDLAVAEAPDGSATWSEPGQFLQGMKIGAPPDVFSADGQDWGLAPLSPHVVAQSGGFYETLIESLMKSAGALRIDHAMSLARLFVTPEGLTARRGTYLSYPMAEILATLVVLSQRSRTILIGEDLGNVPEGFRCHMQEARILSYRVLCFEHSDAKFRPAASYPALSLACATTHDLPPLRAWWGADDIEERLDQGLIDEKAAAAQRADRRTLKYSLLRALAAEGIPSPPAFPAESWQALALRVHSFLAGTPSVLAVARLADMTGETRSTNVPGTAQTYPNWRPKLSLTVEEIERSPMVQAIAHLFAAERPR